MERFTISLDDRLASQFDAWRTARSYANRSEAVRDLLRSVIGRGRSSKGSAGQCVACLSYVFNHHERDLAERLTHLQHEHHELTMSTMHAHLDHEHCLETVLLRGSTSQVTAFADRVMAERGVHHGNINVIDVDLHEPHAARQRAARKRDATRSATAHVHVKPTT
jgi:CopG family nickel-responsive transcriptional regulator